jgi:hypothetical protein
VSGEVIKSFLVGLGFGVDDASLAKFNKAIVSATIKVAALSTAVVGMAAGITKAVTGISADFEKMGYEFRIIAPAINKALVLRNELLKAYSAAGINITQVVQNSVKLNMSLEKTKFILEALYKSVGSRFFTYITKQSDQFRENIYKNLPKIQNALEKFIKFIFKSLEAVTDLGTRLWSILTRVYDFFVMLDAKTEGWSTIVLGLIAAWKLLNLSFLASPLGILLSLGLAVLALYDDFKTFKEGGKSLIDWGSEATKIFVAFGGAIAAIVAAFYAWKVATSALSQALKVYEAIQAAVNVVMALNPVGLIVLGVTALIALLTTLDAKWSIFGGHLSGFFSGIGGKIMGLVGGAASDFQGSTLGKFVANPIGTSVQNSNQSTALHQQTNINVVGAADAQQTGKSVASQQGRVNRDLVDNMVGSTR